MLERFLNGMNFKMLCDWMICIIYEWWKMYEIGIIHLGWCMSCGLMTLSMKTYV